MVPTRRRSRPAGHSKGGRPVLLVLALLGMVAGVRRDARADELSCYQRARDETMLSHPKALDLCAGALTAAPVSCYKKVTDAQLISDVNAVRLCQCARSDAPAACYIRAANDTDLDEPGRLSVCSPTSVEGLGVGCRPRRTRY